MSVTVGKINTIKVRVGGASQGEKVQSIAYGSRTLKGATDLNLQNGGTGDAILYQANTGTFVLGPVASGTVSSVDAGTF